MCLACCAQHNLSVVCHHLNRHRVFQVDDAMLFPATCASPCEVGDDSYIATFACDHQCLACCDMSTGLHGCRKVAFECHFGVMYLSMCVNMHRGDSELVLHTFMARLAGAIGRDDTIYIHQLGTCKLCSTKDMQQWRSRLIEGHHKLSVSTRPI